MKVVFLQRKAYPDQFSIEKVFDGIKNSLPKEVNVVTAVLPYFSKGFFPRLRSFFWSRQQQGDVNHITGDIHFIAMALKKKKTILTIHDIYFLDHPNLIARTILKIFWLTLPVRHSAFITVISQATKKDLLSRITISENKIRVIPDFLPEGFLPSPFHFNKERPTILQIGTKSNKNVLRLVEAIQGIPCHLVIVGAKNEMIKKQLAEKKISFTWHNRIPDSQLKEEYRKCDLLAFVSTMEGFGLPILEAQATGRPVITSSVSAMPEVAGTGACLVDPMNSKAIRQGILKIIEDDQYREQLIVHGFQNVKQYEQKRIAEMYYSLYKEVAASVSE